jgi:hypothetical protein
MGMHKSGTTLIANILHNSGISMVEKSDSDVSYDQGNFYECKTVQAFNREILNAKPFTGRFTALDLPAPKKIKVKENLRFRIRKFVKKRNKTMNNWGFKDPRNCLTYPIWSSELTEHKIIAIYRCPGEIWPRFRRTRCLYAIPFRAWKFINRWIEYNVRVLDNLKKTKAEFLVLSHFELMNNQGEFERLQDFVKKKLKDQRVPRLWRNRNNESFLLKMVVSLVKRRTMTSPKDIIRKFEELRKK